MSKLILMRHGQSMWNKLNLFTGWVDIPLSQQGIDEALAAGKKISHFPIDLIFTSTLMRAQMTAMLVMSQHESGKVPVITHSGEKNQRDWGKIYSEKTEQNIIPVRCVKELNERMYGTLQGLNKAETIEKFGPEQVKQWRRSYDISPPEGESLAMTAERAIPFFQAEILPLLKQGKNIFVSAHGNSLRAIMMSLDNLSKDEVLSLELETGIPVIYQYENEIFSKILTP